MTRPLPGTRYDAAQLVDAVDHARGDGRYFVVCALIGFPGETRREAALAQVVDKELRPDARQLVLAELARLNPATYLRMMIETGLRSRSIGVQQMAVGALPSLVEEGLAPDLGEPVEGWLRRRLKNPRRQSTWAGWETPGVALALLPTYGVETVLRLLDELDPRLQSGERSRLPTLRAAAHDEEGFQRILQQWFGEDTGGGAAPPPPDPVIRRPTSTSTGS